MTLALETRGLTKDYGSGRGLFGLDLRVHAGEVYGFLGPNGAGKTTTLRLLLDLIRPTRGDARVLGLDPRHDGRALRRRVGYLPGEPALYPALTGRDLLDRIARLRGGVDERLRDDLAERFRAELDVPVQELSSGNRQKVALLVAFQHDPEMLILDEPTAGLDPLMQQEFLDLVGETRRRGRTVLLSSHVLSEVEKVCDRVGILRNGRLLVEASLEELRRHEDHRLVFSFATDFDVRSVLDVPGVVGAERKGRALRVTVHGRLDPLLAWAARHPIMDVETDRRGLEEVFMEHYRRQGRA